MHTALLLLKHCAFVCLFLLFFKIGKSLIAIQGSFHAHIILCQNDAVLNRKSIWLWVENSVQNSIISRHHEMSSKNSLVEITDSPVLKAF